MDSEEKKIEPRPYGSGSSPEEIKAIKDRVYLYEENIIYWKEVPIQSPFQISLFQEKALDLYNKSEMNYFSFLIDLTEATRPSAAVRRSLTDTYNSFPNLVSLAAFTEKNFMLNVAAKFVLGGTKMPFSVHKKIEQAIETIKHAQEEYISKQRKKKFGLVS